MGIREERGKIHNFRRYVRDSKGTLWKVDIDTNHDYEELTITECPSGGCMVGPHREPRQIMAYCSLVGTREGFSCTEIRDIAREIVSIRMQCMEGGTLDNYRHPEGIETEEGIIRRDRIIEGWTSFRSEVFGENKEHQRDQDMCVHKQPTRSKATKQRQMEITRYRERRNLIVILAVPSTPL